VGWDWWGGSRGEVEPEEGVVKLEAERHVEAHRGMRSRIRRGRMMPL
jgi:hypothetical protein